MGKQKILVGFLVLLSLLHLNYGSTVVDLTTHRQTSHQWHVFLPSPQCSGSLIGERWVITSAVCVLKWRLHVASILDRSSQTDVIQSDISTTHVRFGNNQADLTTPGEDLIPVRHTLVYPGFDNSTLDGNIGVLYLVRGPMLTTARESRDEYLELSDSPNICIHSAKIAGWGRSSGLRRPFPTLHEDTLLFPSLSACAEAKGNIVLRTNGSGRICSADEGSPLIELRNGSWTLLGVYSRGKGCGIEQENSVFTSVDLAVVQWLRRLFKVKDRTQCKPAGHKILESPSRSFTNILRKSDRPFCDKSLEEGWYRFKLNGEPSEMVTSCPDPSSCGTHAQVWLRPEGMPDFGEDGRGTACVAWDRSTMRVCCMWEFPIDLAHCGDFVVYRLKQLQECPMAYCAKQAGVACGPGKTRFAPNCTVRKPYPILTGRPRVRPFIPMDPATAGSSIQLHCTYSVQGTSSVDVSYEVTWYKVLRFSGGKRVKLMLASQRITGSPFVANLGASDFQLGDTFICAVAAFYSNTPHKLSPVSSSEEFFAGIEVHPQYIPVPEGQETYDIVITTTVPIVCPPMSPNCSVRIPLYILPVVSYLQRSPVFSRPDVTLSACEVVLKPQECEDMNCGRKSVLLRATADFFREDMRTSRIITAPVQTELPLWKSHDPPDVFVLVHDVLTVRCVAFTDSNVRTLQSRFYRLANPGTYVMYSKKEFEVHSRLWSCSSSGNPAFCTCAVVVRADSDVIEMNMCEGEFLKTALKISVKSPLPLANGTQIMKADHGKRFTVYFPSGSLVRVDVFEWGLNVYVHSPSTDINSVVGLCGEEMGRVATGSLPPEMNLNKWRLKEGQSMFEYKRSTKLDLHKTEIFCTCGLENAMKKSECNLRDRNCSSTCEQDSNPWKPVLIAETSITTRVTSLQETFASKRRKADTLAKKEDDTLSDDPVTTSGPHPSAGQETAPSLTLPDVTSHCNRLLTDTPVGRVGRGMLGPLQSALLVKICIRDVLHTGMVSMAMGLLGVLETLYEEISIQNVSTWMTSSEGKLVPLTSVWGVLCPRQCNDHGICIEGKCICRQGYAAEDCSVRTDQSPEVFTVHEGGLCNLRESKCQRVRVVGRGFFHSSDLKCSFQAINFRDQKQFSIEKRAIVTHASFDSYRLITCFTPKPPSKSTLYGYQVRVSNDGKLWSKTLPLVVYDRLCLSCSASTVECSVKEGYAGDTCNKTRGHCDSSPCIHGNCTSSKEDFLCYCQDGYKGKTCNETVNHCESSPCIHGNCTSSKEDFFCTCQDGYKGKTCNETVNHCESSPCIHGNCTSSKEGFFCTCQDGYKGKTCNETVNHCESSPCIHGNCTSSKEDFLCYCQDGYKGKICNETIDHCESSPCIHGNCTSSKEGFNCNCQDGFVGAVCDTEVKPTDQNPCKQGIRINVNATSFLCNCYANYTGVLCETRTHPCSHKPCERGQCVRINATSFRCDCNHGYSGLLCDVKTNLCQSKPCKEGVCISHGDTFECIVQQADACRSSPCRHGACVSNGTWFVCKCRRGYTGELCDRMTHACELKPCQHGICMRLGARFKCRCSNGYRGLLCNEVDPCHSKPCVNGTCVSLSNDFACQCRGGFTGKRCETAIDRCQGNPCNHGSCARDGNSFSCICGHGYTGRFCEVQLGPCASNPCYPNVKCHKARESVTGFRCGPCPEGYTGDGVNCTSLCPLPCPYGMRCSGFYTCRCPVGYYGIGCKTPFCRFGCHNGGRCVQPEVCRCAQGFGGRACVEPRCDPVCSNGGTCVGPNRCRCPRGFQGPRCEPQRCLVSCVNGGTCIGPYVCRCMPGYAGRRCEIAPCIPGCQHGGACVSRDVCRCPRAYAGNRCQYPVCDPSCLNGGRCARPGVCVCPQLWKGNRCETPVCHVPCLNGGRCSQPNKCSCAPGYEGSMCHQAVCKRGCLNGGRCIRPDVCACPFGFTGESCFKRALP